MSPFKIVAGQEVADALRASKEQVVPRSTYRPDCFESEALCAWQRDSHARGFRDVELVSSIYGWSVRSGSGLDNFALLASSRSKQIDGSFEDAVRWAREWCAEVPGRRYAWVREAVAS